MRKELQQMKGLLFILSLLLSQQFIAAPPDVTKKTYQAARVEVPIKIDGLLDDEAWTFAGIADDFIQLEPVEGNQASQRSYIRVVYDNTAIYFSAYLFDSSPDSILTQLGNRDDGSNLNADAFRVSLDPYNTRQSGYVFEVSASGVQTDSYDQDLTYDAVWESAVQLQSDGWSLEMKIPYSAIRFPSRERQEWGIQFTRFIRRSREQIQWSYTPKSASNKMFFWGTLEGIEKIEPPLRLSVTPYLSFYTERSPHFLNGEHSGNDVAYSYSGGADLKLGLDERFTLDVTLLPDFSQVQSDNKVKNLSAFETVFEERRPFFKEGTDLFKKGNLFYSRRIGRTPALFYSVSSLLNDDEVLSENPDRSSLINASKLTGRTDKGLGLGIMNAITAEMQAEAKDPEGNVRKIQTDPLTNYSVVIADQQLKNNSNFYIVNANTLREGSWRDANVSAAQYTHENKGHDYRISGRYSLSQIFQRDSEGNKQNLKGNQYSFSAAKIKGNHKAGVWYEVGDKNYNKNDLGVSFVRDYTDANVYYTYVKYNPFWKYFKYGSLNIWTNRTGRESENNQLTELQSGFDLFLLFNNNWSIYSQLGTNLTKGKDYYEPRIEGMYYEKPKRTAGSINFTTNYNRKLSFDFGSRSAIIPVQDAFSYGYYVVPRIRLSDKWSVFLSHFYDRYVNERGWVSYEENESLSSVFGERNVITIENSVTTKYLFKNDMSLSLVARHYWSDGIYDRYFNLEGNGKLSEINANYDADFNSAFFNVDMVFNWQFAPGSSFLIVYKNAISRESTDSGLSYFKNLDNILDNPQTNSVSVKILYYFDYQYLNRKKS